MTRLNFTGCQLFTAVLTLVFISGCASGKREALRVALASDCSSEKIAPVFNALGAHGAAKGEYWAKEIGKNNFSHFVIAGDFDQLKGFDLEIKPQSQLAKVLSDHFVKDWTFIRDNEILDLTFNKVGDAPQRGGFRVDNPCFKGSFMFIYSDSNGGQVTKLVIPKKNTATMAGALIVFYRETN